MNDADLELTITRWLAADAGTLQAPARLRRRIMDLPTEPAPAAQWWHRFATLPAMSSAAVTAGALGILAATMFFGLFDAPAGADGETCNNRQVQHAIDNLHDAEGYRYVNRDQLSEPDPNVELDFDDPQYVWTDAWVSEGAYLAADKARDVPVSTLPALYNRGYTEAVHIGGARYELRELDGTRTWMRSTNWPTANLAYGYVMGAFPTFSVPGVNSLDFGGTAVPSDMPGTSGCTAAALIPAIDPGVETAIPIERRIIALRIDVGSERPTAIHLGPEVGGLESEGQSRSTWELTWETPPSEEFQAPSESVPDPNDPSVPQSFVPDPSPSPLPVDPSAWAPIELSAEANAGVTDVVAGDGLFVAVGGEYAGADASALIWTSTDGATWETIDAPSGFEGTSFESVEWNGSTYLAIAYRNYESPEGPQFSTARPETWLSTDGFTWEPGGGIGPDEESGEVANPGRPIAGGPGWMTSGSIWSLADNQQRPAIFASADGVRWDTIELEDTGSGSIGRMVEMPDGMLFATGCESPGSTNSGSAGQGCYMRRWLSDDGLVWTPGPMIDVEIHDVARWGDRLIGIGSVGEPTQQDDPFTTPSLLMTSADGVTWEPLSGFPTPAWPSGLHVVGDDLVVTGQVVDPTLSFASAWRTTGGESWEAIGLGLPPAAVSTYVAGVVETPSGLAFMGQAQIGETGSMPIVWLEP